MAAVAAAVAAAAQSSSLFVVIILLLFACPLLVGIVLPHFVARCSLRRLSLTCLQRAMVGCYLLRSQYVVVARSRPRLLAGRRSSRPFLTLHPATSARPRAQRRAEEDPGGHRPTTSATGRGIWGMIRLPFWRPSGIWMTMTTTSTTAAVAWDGKSPSSLSSSSLATCSPESASSSASLASSRHCVVALSRCRVVVLSCHRRRCRRSSQPSLPPSPLPPSSW